MRIENNQQTPFQAFYRNSSPCMQYLAKNFDGNKIKFNTALEILDKKCSKHKFFDMFYVPKDNSIKIVPKDKAIENLFPNVGRYMTIPESERYINKGYSEVFPDVSGKNSNNSLLKRIINIFSIKKAKNFISINYYNKLPSNVIEAVDIIEKMEHSLF